MLRQAGYRPAVAVAAATWAVTLVIGVCPAVSQSAAPVVEVPPAAPLLPPIEVPPVGLPQLQLPSVPSPIQQPSPVRLPQPPQPVQGESPRTSGDGAGGSSSAGPAVGRATTPVAREAPGPGPGKTGGRRPSPEAGRAADRAGRRESGKRRAARRDSQGPSLSDRVGDVIVAVPWQLTVTIGALAILALLMAGRSALSAVRAARLTLQRAELRSDVGALQSALLPPVPEAVGDVRLSVAYRPAEGPAAGGDFHDVVPLGDGRFALILGDVSGHGREALAQTALVHYTVRAYLAAGLQPRLALRLTDQSLEGSLGDDFVTVLAAIYDPEESTLRYATAGHPIPLVVGTQAEHPVDVLTSPPIGIGPRTGERETCVSVSSGSRICFFTDGLTEARDDKGVLLEREGLARILAEGGESLDAHSLLDRVTEVTTAGSDDMTACLLDPIGASGTGGVTQEIEIDTTFDALAELEGFLAQCGLDPGQIHEALNDARLKLSFGDPVLMRVAGPAGAAEWDVAPVNAFIVPPLAAALA